MREWKLCVVGISLFVAAMVESPRAEACTPTRARMMMPDPYVREYFAQTAYLDALMYKSDLDYQRQANIERAAQIDDDVEIWLEMEDYGTVEMLLREKEALIEYQLEILENLSKAEATVEAAKAEVDAAEAAVRQYEAENNECAEEPPTEEPAPGTDHEPEPATAESPDPSPDPFDESNYTFDM